MNLKIEEIELIILRGIEANWTAEYIAISILSAEQLKKSSIQYKIDEKMGRNI